MPELPEVETIVRQLRTPLVGRSIARITIADRKLRPFDATLCAGKVVVGVERRGKHIVLCLARAAVESWLVIHLRMSGRLRWMGERTHKAEDGDRGVTPRATIHFDRGVLDFIDSRRFGTFRVTADRRSILPAGVEPLSRSLTVEVLEKLLSETRQPLKLWLLRQDRLVGLGNIYAAEVLFHAELDPHRPCCSLGRDEVRALLQAIRSVLRRAIRFQGTTFSTYRQLAGERGGFQHLLRVYGREGRECQRCGEAIRRIRQGSRSTFYCAACQR